MEAKKQKNIKAKGRRGVASLLRCSIVSFDDRREAGYLAITVALIFSLIALFVSAALGTRTLLARFNRLEYLNKKTSFVIARSCDDVALLRLRADPAYAGNETVSVGGTTCTIFPIESVPPNTVIKTKAVVSRATTNLKFTVNSKLQHISLEELTVLP
ncbi:MAG: hypothetical protein Q7R85_01360 [bacterium]|nr:hypothetical protein [bacterium]